MHKPKAKRRRRREGAYCTRQEKNELVKLAETVFTPLAAAEWVRQPSAIFGGYTPEQIVAVGGMDQVREHIMALRTILDEGER